MPGASVTREDGVTTVTLSQSWIGTYLACPRQAQAVLLGTAPESHTPEADFGITLHAACHAKVETGSTDRAYKIITGGDGFDAKPMVGYPLPVDHKWNTDKSKGASWSLDSLALDCFDLWESLHWSKLKDLPNHKPETMFERVIFDDGTLRIVIRGSVDYHSTPLDLWDWKFSSRRWVPWELQRYDHQSTTYVLGLHGVRLPAGVETVRFNWGVVNPDNFEKSTHVYVDRTQADLDAMVDLLHSVAVRMARDYWNPEQLWEPLGHDWHCSPKWCPIFDRCKGRHGQSW